MNKGSKGVDLLGTAIADAGSLIVVDIDTIITEKYRFFGLIPYFALTDENRKAIRLCMDLRRKTDSVILILCVGERKAAISELMKFLIDLWDYVHFPEEESLKNWLHIKKPELHLATQMRKYYLPQSITIQDYIAQFS